MPTPYNDPPLKHWGIKFMLASLLSCRDNHWQSCCLFSYLLIIIGIEHYLGLGLWLWLWSHGISRWLSICRSCIMYYCAQLLQSYPNQPATP